MNLKIALALATFVLTPSAFAGSCAELLGPASGFERVGASSVFARGEFMIDVTAGRPLRIYSNLPLASDEARAMADAPADPTAPELRRSLAADGRRLLARFEGAKLVQLAGEVDARHLPRVDERTRVAGFRLGFLDARAGVSILRLLRGSFEYEITDSERGARVVTGTQLEHADLADVSDADLGFTPPPVDSARKRDHFVGGLNVSAYQRRTGRSFADLARAVKGNDQVLEPFLGRHESLDERLRAWDDEARALGLDHRALATPLLRMRAALADGRAADFTYAGYRYHWAVVGRMGEITSPFLNELTSGADVTLTNLTTGEVLSFSDLVPELIYRYAFYADYGTRRALSPAQVVAVLPFLRDGRAHNRRYKPRTRPASHVSEFIVSKVATPVYAEFQFAGGQREHVTYDRVEIRESAGDASVVLRRGTAWDVLNGRVNLVGEETRVSAVEVRPTSWTGGVRPRAVRLTFPAPIEAPGFHFPLTPAHDVRRFRPSHFVRFLNANFADRPVTRLNLYDDQGLGETHELHFERARALDGKIKLRLRDGRRMVELVTSFDALVPHARRSDLILAVHDVKGLNVAVTSSLRASLSLDLGHGR